MDGIRLSVFRREAVSPSMGFCTLTDTGPVQVLYGEAASVHVCQARWILTVRVQVSVGLTQKCHDHHRHPSGQ